MSTWIKTSLGFLCVYFVLLIALMPMKVVIQQFTLPKEVQLSEVKGSVWSSEIATVQVNGFVINQVNVDISLLSLFTLNPRVDASFGDALASGPEGEISLDNLLSSPRFFDGEISISANEIFNNLALPLPLRAHSFIDINLEEFIAGNAVCSSLSGKISWPKSAVTALEQKVKLGKLAADLSCNQGDAVLTVQKNNDLGLSLSVFIGKGFNPSGNGFLAPTDNTPNEVKQALPFLGKPDNQGRYKLIF